MSPAALPYARIEWLQDGTPRSMDFEDVYFSPDGGLAESAHVYLQGNQLPARWDAHFQTHRHFVVGELGFGTGLDFLLTAQAFRQFQQKNAEAELFYYAVEKFPLHPDDLQQALRAFPELAELAADLLRLYPSPARGWQHLRLGKGLHLTLLFDEVDAALMQLYRSEVRVDAWFLDARFLDGFAASRNPETWHQDILLRVAKCSRAGASASSFSVAGAFRRALDSAGFVVSKQSGDGRKRQMSSAVLKQRKPTREAARFRKKQIAILGAGIAGCATARRLAQAGHQVSVFDSAAAPSGVLQQHDAALAAPRWTSDYDLATQLQLQGLLRLHQQLRDQANDSCVLWRGCDELQDMSPGNNGISALPGAPFCRPSSLPPIQEHIGGRNCIEHMLALALRPQILCADLLSADGIQVYYNTSVDLSALTTEPVLKLANKSLRFDAVVLCTGAKALKTAAHLLRGFPLQAVRGQLSYLRPHPALALSRPLRFGGYLLPEFNQRLSLGATFETQDDSHLDATHETASYLLESSHQTNWQRLLQALPERCQHRPDFCGGAAGWRLHSRDHLPLCGRHPQQNALWLNTAHGSHGLMTAFVGADVVAAEINGDLPGLSPALLRAVHPSRFIPA